MKVTRLILKNDTTYVGFYCDYFQKNCAFDQVILKTAVGNRPSYTFNTG